MAGACPKLHAEILESKFDDTEVDVKARTPDGRLAGLAMLTPSGAVGYITVSGDMKRCGVGTFLYEQLAALACERGQRLRSDVTRSKTAEAFWQKQVRKGRAECADDTPQGCVYYRLREACPRGGLGRRRRRARRR